MRLKRFTIFLILAIINSSIIIAQKVSIGGEFGLISSKNTNYKLTDIQNRRNTYYSGINFNYKYNEIITLTAGIDYLKQGYKHKTCYIFEEGVKNELVGKIDYLILPLSSNFYIGRRNKLIITIGAYGGWNINAKQEYPEIIGGCEIYYPEDISNVTQKYMFGGLFGIGYNIYQNEKIEIKSMLKYYQGISNTMSNNHPHDIVWKDRYSSLLMTFTIDYKL